MALVVGLLCRMPLAAAQSAARRLRLACAANQAVFYRRVIAERMIGPERPAPASSSSPGHADWPLHSATTHERNRPRLSDGSSPFRWNCVRFEPRESAPREFPVLDCYFVLAAPAAVGLGGALDGAPVDGAAGRNRLKLFSPMFVHSVPGPLWNSRNISLGFNCSASE